jgi:hypothetical protein
MWLIGIEESVIHFQKHLLIRKCKGVTSSLFEIRKKIIFLLCHTIWFAVSEYSIQFLLSGFASAIHPGLFRKPIHRGFDAGRGCDLLNRIS